MASAPENRELQATTPGAEQGNVPAPSDKKPCSSRSPVHPIPQLQGPFEESIFEASQKKENQWIVILDAQSRRKELLENAEYERLCGRKWRQRAGERQVKFQMTRSKALSLPLTNKLIGYRYHPLWKLISQISFGVHLLAKGLAKSNLEVLKILQRHVDELDGFIERNTEDYFIIQVDVRTRIQYLSLPLQNLDVFDEMLQDRNFRLAMIEYNEKIEHAIDRFTMAVKDSLKDIQKGREAIGALWHYIGQSAKENRPLPSDLVAVHNAMLANTEGWNMALSKLSRKGMALESALAQLGLAITEMQRRVGVASRRDVMSLLQNPNGVFHHRSSKKRFFGRALSIRASRSSISEKPLPSDPDILGAVDPRPISRQTQGHRMSQKSVPNLRAAQNSEEFTSGSESRGRAKSVHGATESQSSTTFFPRIQRSLSKRFSRAGLATKQNPSGEIEGTPTKRPATAPSRSLKSRSTFLEQHKSLKHNNKENDQDTTNTTVSLQQNRPSESGRLARRETMKNQLLHFFKSDRVVEAWESAANREKKVSRAVSQKKKEGPLSVFRARATDISDIPGSRTTFFEKDLEQQMAWLQEGTEILNTYSLKPRRNVAPRIHVLSVHTSLIQESEEEHYYGNEKREDSAGDGQSIITALPAPPTILESFPRVPSASG
ncbi:uncharacterized protein CDV56_106090 [Aspergillus thermomutatus]|uniref:Uncharacterized protein n=1 Tax=Aspergillus thermomutatus TaxID=41047 RepID=A0A397GPG9_ASPTH|nr:uncharacterized protein CDV56_106090 [Aspergillus thermomutatus]RHZ49900.1 hypothetical protein CDV56_106090 [Aspergillus thermomutatus]